MANNGREFKCDQCDLKYTCTSSLLMHMLDKHQGVKLSCDSCDFQTGVTGGKQKIATHVRLKHGKLNLKCVICQFGTHYDNILWHHKKRVHDRDEKRFECNKCDNISRHRHHLNQHIARMHNTGEDMVKCNKCVYQTSTKFNLKRHNEWSHEENQVCAVCPFSGCTSCLSENRHQNITYNCNESDTT